jgi:erythromycin esterase
LQNAETAVNVERYYVSAVASNNESWNIRDRHMAETVNRILTQKGSAAKIIIWAHNTHVGDARATTMKEEGMVNIGQLIREEHSNEGVYVVGFGTYSGTVIAAASWGNALQKLSVPPAMSNSWEALLHNDGAADKILFLKTLRQNNQYMKRIGHRAIGVVYNPSFEEGNYVPSVLPDRYDAFVFIDKTQALHPLSESSSSRKAARRIQD